MTPSAATATATATATGTGTPVGDIPPSPGTIADHEAEVADKHTEEPEIVAVGTVSHVIRRAFHQFYQADTKPSDHHATQDALSDPEATHPPGVDPPVDSTADPEPSSPSAVVLNANPFVELGDSRKQLIRDALALKHSTAGHLVAFLEQRHRDAHAKDDAIADDLARQGLIIKSQIPMGPTNLQLNPEELEPFGAFGATLVHAKQLVADYQRTRLDKSGNGAASVARKVAGITREPPGYLSTTSAYEIRKHTTLSTHQHHIETVKSRTISKVIGETTVTETETETAADGDESSSSSPSKSSQSVRFGSAAADHQMPAQEKRKNMAILERMQTKLDFLRNPRYASKQDNSINESDTNNDVNTQPHDSFIAVPSPVEFTDYDSGGVYEQTVYVRNVSHLSRRVRVLPPASLFFSIDRIAFPDASGLVAPGMDVKVTLRFAPDSRADYKDSMTVQFENGGGNSSNSESTGQFTLPILAHRTPPELSIPLLLRAQHALVGSQSVTRIPCKNTGGKARFWLLSETDWRRCEAASTFRPGAAVASMVNDSARPSSVLRVGAFTLSPTQMELTTGESVTLTLTFLPSAIGDSRDKFVMVCDNCLVRVFTLAGRGCQVELSIASVNDQQPIDTTIARMGRVSQLVFAHEQLLHASTTQRFSVANDTPLALKYTWRFQEQDQSSLGQQQLRRQVPCPFRIEPAQGAFKPSDAAAFTVTFTPLSAQRFTHWRLVLLINDIPACSMPGPRQLSLLAETFQRLRDHEQQQQQQHGAGDQVTQLTAAEQAVESMRLTLRGAGKLGSFHLEPTALRIQTQDETESEELQFGNSYTATTSVVNDCDAQVRVCWDPSRARLVATGGSEGEEGGEKLRRLFDLQMSHVEMDILPRSHMSVELTFTPLATGHFTVVVPCAIVDPFASDSHAKVERWLRINGVVAEPKLCITQQEVDFGLVLVSAKTETTLTIRNDSRVAAGDWQLVHLEAPVPVAAMAPHVTDEPSSGTSTTTSQQLSPRGLRRIGSKDSISSRRSSSVHSTSSGGGGGGGSRTGRSSTGSLAMFTTRDLAPRATITFQPATGRLAPGETMAITVMCQAGSLTERFRGTFSLRAVQATLPPSYCSQQQQQRHPHSVSVSARAEIQSPNVFLSPLRLALGTSYLGVRVDRTLQLVNVSNLEAAFKFMEPQGVSKAHSIEFVPSKGVLRSKETLSVRLSYTPRQAGKTTTLLACSVQGLASPLGFEVTSNHKGLVLTYDVLSPTDPLPLAPMELATKRGVRVEDGELEPDTNASTTGLPKLQFGDAIPLTERRTLRLVLRNFSGIDANVELEPKRFAAATAYDSLDYTTSISSSSSTSSSLPRHSRLPSRASKTDKTSSSTTTSGSVSRSKLTTGSRTSSMNTTTKRKSNPLLLSDDHEPAQRFQTNQGRAYLREQLHAQQDRTLLRDGRGVAFLVSSDLPIAPTATSLAHTEVKSLRIAPWQQAVVEVTCFNNLPGVFHDVLACRAAGLPPVLLPIQATVVGTPLVLDRNCVGLHFPVAHPPPPQHNHHQQQQPTKSTSTRMPTPTPTPTPTFAFGHVCVRAPAITRTLRVLNRGPRAAKLKWKLVAHDRENQLVHVSLRVDFAARVQLQISPLDDALDGATEFPFEIQPPQSLVAPFASTAVRVTFFPSTTSALASRVLLVADAQWLDAPVSLVSSPSSSSLASIELVDGAPQLSESVGMEDQRWETSGAATRPPATAAGKAIQAVRVANALASRGGYTASPPGTSNNNNNNSPVSSTTPKCVRVLLSANTIEPELFLDQQRCVQPPAPYHVTFTTWSTLLSSSSTATPTAAAAAWSHAFHRKELSLVNHLSARVTFRLEATGPFAVTRAESLAPKHPLATSDLPAAHRKADGESFLFTLPPQMAVRLELRVDPLRLTGCLEETMRQETMTKSSQSSKVSDTSRKDKLKLHVDGELLVRFTNDSVQRIRLRCGVLRPLVVVSPSVHNFGKVHLSRTRSVTVRVANPTPVPAAFAVVHVPRPRPLSRAQKQEMETHHAQFVDDASVFSFSQMCGVVRGPTVSLRSAGGAPQPAANSIKDLLDAQSDDTRLVFAPLEIHVQFQPRILGKRYKCRFRLVVDHGVDFEVVLEGQGHLDEVEYSDQQRPIVKTSELTHQNLIFKRLASS